VVIYGASGHGKVVKDVIKREGKYDLLGFIDDNSDLKADDNACAPIIGNFRSLEQGYVETDKIILAIGKNRGREKLYNKITELRTNFDYITAIHPSAEIAESVDIGSGTVIMANATVNSDTKIGSHAIVNTGATIDHDCIVGNFAHISPGVNLAGNVEVGELSHLGIGTSVVQGVKIGRDSVIGAGAAVVDNVPDGVVAVGVPAQVKRKNRGPN